MLQSLVSAATERLRGYTVQQVLFAVFGTITAVSAFAATKFEQPILLIIPAALLVAFQFIVDFRPLFFLLIACIPLSVEFNFTPSLGTDLPIEPLIIGLMFAYFGFLLSGTKRWSMQVIKHPILLLLLLHFLWSAMATVNSGAPLLSVKWLLAKLWYISTFTFLGLELLREERDFRRLYWFLSVPLVFTALWVLSRQMSSGFSFEYDDTAMGPFYRNHVNYAATLSIASPFLFFGYQWFKGHKWSKLLWFASLLITLMGIQFSYTRAAYIALAMAVGVYYIVRFRLMKHTLLVTSFAAIIGVGYLVYDNNYMKFAPNFEKTIVQDNFNDLVSSTYKLQDISTMERVNRWVAGAHMVADRPLMGYGPSCFYTFYKKYLVARFRTYVTRNNEHSTAHCYYLLMMIEQGFIGFLIWVALVFGILISGERIYHQTDNENRRRVVLMALLSQTIIFAFLLINDMIETDKVGSFFFLNIAILVNCDMLNKRDREEIAVEEAII